MAFPWQGIDLFFMTIYGGFGFSFSGTYLGLASGIAQGGNPPYPIDFFLAMHPKFFGMPTQVFGCSTVNGSNIITISSANGLSVGQFFQAPGMPASSIITALTSTTITASTSATADQTNVTLSVYAAMPIPLLVIQCYLNLAYASLMQSRWCEAWLLAMGWYIAHYCTLYAKSDASQITAILQTAIHGEIPQGTTPGATYILSSTPPSGTLQGLYENGVFLTPGVDYTLTGTVITLTNSTGEEDSLYAVWPVQSSTSVQGVSSTARIAAQGLATGIKISQSVGDVSASYAQLTALESWGDLNLTVYGQQLATMAMSVGAGMVYIR